MPKRERSDLEMLKGRLVEAAALYAKETPDLDVEPDATHWQREGAAKALVAILNFLKPHTNVSERKPLRALLGALDDANEGRPNPMLAPRVRRRDAPRVSIELASTRITQMTL